MYWHISNLLQTIYTMYREFLCSLSNAAVIMYFLEDDEDRIGGSITHKMLDDQHRSTCAGQWNYPTGLGGYVFMYLFCILTCILTITVITVRQQVH